MPYVIMMSGDFSDAEKGILRKKWAMRDSSGQVMLFETRQAAEEFETGLKSPYEGVAYWNALAPGQHAGYRGQVVWVSRDPAKRPYWAR
jgi:hypothetical protein